MLSSYKLNWVISFKALESLYFEEMFLEFFLRHVGSIVIVQMVVHAGDVLHIVQHFGNVVAYDDDGAFLVDLLQHLVHLFLESTVDVSVGLVEYHHIGL